MLISDVAIYISNIYVIGSPAIISAPFIISDDAYSFCLTVSPPPSTCSSLHHDMTDPLITETNGVELICPNGATLPKLPSVHHQNLPHAVLPPSPLSSVRRASMYIHQLNRASRPAHRARPRARTHTYTRTQASRDGRQTAQVNKHHTAQWFM